MQQAVRWGPFISYHNSLSHYLYVHHRKCKNSLDSSKDLYSLFPRFVIRSCFLTCLNNLQSLLLRLQVTCQRLLVQVTALPLWELFRTLKGHIHNNIVTITLSESAQISTRGQCYSGYFIWKQMSSILIMTLEGNWNQNRFPEGTNNKRNNSIDITLSQWE